MLPWVIIQAFFLLIRMCVMKMIVCRRHCSAKFNQCVDITLSLYERKECSAWNFFIKRIQWWNASRHCFCLCVVFFLCFRLWLGQQMTKIKKSAAHVQRTFCCMTFFTSLLTLLPVSNNELHGFICFKKVFISREIDIYFCFIELYCCRTGLRCRVS